MPANVLNTSRAVMAVDCIMPDTRMAPGSSNRKVANSLVTLSSAAILTVYTAGLMKTRAAAELLEEASNERRPAMPAPATAGETAPPAPIEPPPDVAAPTTVKSPAVVVPPAPEPKAAPTPTAPMAPAAVPAPVPTKAEPIAAAPAKTAAQPTPTPANTPVVTELAASTPASAAPPPATPAVFTTAAPTATPAAPPADSAPVGEKAPLRPKEIYMDGTYLGWGSSRHGDIQASVTIEDGRIVATKIARCLTRYSCSWVSHLPPQVIARQSPEVDYVSGATQSANAFYWAVIDALNKAK